MAVYQLPSGKWRAQIQRNGRNESLGSFRTKREARDACFDARKTRKQNASTITLGEFWERWITDPLFERDKPKTRRIYQQQTKGFVGKYGQKPIDQIGDREVSEWLAGGKKNYTAPALRTMFNDAAKPIAGRLIQRNPFASLGLSKTKGRKNMTPPSEEVVWSLIACAERVLPSFAAYLQVAAFTGMRPSELDILRWANVDFQAERIKVLEQYDAGSGVVTLPKNGTIRQALLTPHARSALLALPRESEFCFVNTKRGHFREGSRNSYWRRTRRLAGFDGDLYLTTRHFFATYLLNVKDLPEGDVGILIGHNDGGQLVRELYGHRDHRKAFDRGQAVFA